MAIYLTEEIVSNRVNLTHNRLEDVKSLSLPGSYHEKAIGLGNCLQKFSNLKSLDLSRNALETIDGIENLSILEKLNLYYNNISNLDELKRLKHCPNLREIDLRLNPVTRSDPDYRLYLIHMLPRLRKLDDRGVSDRERQSGLIHFASSQASEMTVHGQKKEVMHKLSLPRVKLAAKLGSGSDNDDVAMMDMVDMKGGDLTQDRPLTGSCAKVPMAEEYSLESLKRILSHDDLDIGTTKSLQNLPDKNGTSSLPLSEYDDPVLKDYRDKYPKITGAAVPEYVSKARIDTNLRYEDEFDAYTKYKTRAYFTPHPMPGLQMERAGQCSSVDKIRKQSGSLPASKHAVTVDDCGDAQCSRSTMHCIARADQRRQTVSDIPCTSGQLSHLSVDPCDPGTVKVRLRENLCAQQVLCKILDLVDRYWNGTKSLHHHDKFLALSLDVIEKLHKESSIQQMLDDVRGLKQQLERLKRENDELRQFGDYVDLDAASGTQAEMSTESMRREASGNPTKKQQTETLPDMSDNPCLPVQRNRQQPTGGNIGEAEAASSVHIDDLRRQNRALSHEVDGLRGQLKQYAQTQEVISMLQESHKSLLLTNQHLVNEMEEERHRHHRHVEQMHWSYDQMKQTIGCIPSSVMRDSTLTDSSLSAPLPSDGLTDVH